MKHLFKPLASAAILVIFALLMTALIYAFFNILIKF